jgi:thiamine transport system ATP-binding protein
VNEIEPGLMVDDVSVTYGSSPAVDGVTLAVAPGEIVALLGPSGCGKSTLLRAVAGLEPLAGGTIRWDGEDLADVPVHRRRFGLMFQDGQLFPHQTVAQNVGYGLKMAGVRGPERDDAVSRLLDLVDLEGLGGRSVTTLSGGQAQRVALARALAPEPRLLLLDEPLSALDAELREQLRTELREIIIRTGTAALWVTHDPSEADAAADRVLRMNHGRLVR